MDFSSLTSFKRTINNDVDYSDFLKIFHFNVIIECFIFVGLLIFLIISPLLWAVVSAFVAFLTLGMHVFIVHMLRFLCFLVVMCFLNKLMMMMMIKVDK